MGKIHLLPKIVQNQIAAGEVIERPASIVKELVENSIDAQATSITVDIQDGGIERIVITDNGIGMDPDDASLSIQRHATSKISSTDDLFDIHSYGFRGEALASIAAVSHFTLATRTAEQTSGVQLRIIEEDILSSAPAGLPVGTRISIEHLFFNTPARKKYLKKPQTEYRYILSLIQHIALANQGISFTLIHNGKTTFSVRASDRINRIENVVGNTFIENSVPLFLDSPELSIGGYISKPHAARNTRKDQYVFVNNRPVTSDIIQKAVQEAFHRITVPGTYPMYVLFVNIDPSLVDVNVHPRKKEVKFADPQRVFREVRRSVADALMKYEVAPRITLEKNRPTTSNTTHSPLSRATSPYATSHASALGSMSSLFTHTSHGTAPKPQPIAHFTKERSPSFHKQQIPYTVIGQIHRCYIAAEGPEGFVLIDQHAAHERVLFDALCIKSRESSIHTQQLLTPDILELSPQEQALFNEHKSDFIESGFEIEEVGDGSISITAIPAELHTQGEHIGQLVRNMLHEFEGLEGECTHSDSLRTFQEKVLAYTACRSAVKFGDTLTNQEMEHIVEKLSHTERPDTCPHGRTSRVIMTLGELKKFFDR